MRCGSSATSRPIGPPTCAGPSHAFDDAGLTLPPEIWFAFDASRLQCGGGHGLCRPDCEPPEVVVCEPDGDIEYQRTHRRITLLHELAHVWHWSLGDGSEWPDLSAILTAEPTRPGSEFGETSWPKRMEERVAVA